MDEGMTILTNGHHRDILGGWELSDKEKSEFDYMDFESEDDPGSFFRYRGEIYDLGEFLAIDHSMIPEFSGWAGYQSDSFFSGIVIRYVDNFEGVVVGRYFS